MSRRRAVHNSPAASPIKQVQISDDWLNQPLTPEKPKEISRSLFNESESKIDEPKTESKNDELKTELKIDEPKTESKIDEPKTELETTVHLVVELGNDQSDRDQNVKIRYINDALFISAILNGQLPRAEEELQKIRQSLTSAEYQEYIRSSEIIMMLCKDIHETGSLDIFNQAVTIISREVADAKTSRDDTMMRIGSIIKASRISAIKWLISNGFQVYNSAEVIIRLFLRLHINEPTMPNRPAAVDSAKYDHSAEYFDVFQELIKHTKIKEQISNDLIKSLNEYCPIVTEVLLSLGMDPTEIIDGKPIAWYIMRSAKREIMFRDQTSLGQALLTRLANSSKFAYHAQYFTECGDPRVFKVIIGKADFCADLTKFMDDGSLYISTITEDRFVNELVTKGSPLPDGNMFTVGLSDKKAIVEKLHSQKPIDFTRKHPTEDLTLFSYYLNVGPMSTNLLQTLQYIYQENKLTPTNCLTKVYANPASKSMNLSWIPLHCLWSRYRFAWSQAEKDSFHAIAKWLYEITVRHSGYILDNYGRIPIMTMPLPSADNAQEYKDLLELYAPLESLGLKSIGISCNAGPIISSILNWTIQEGDSRKKAVEIRARHADPTFIKGMPWR